MESRVEIPWKKPKRILVFIVVYNAESSLVSVLKRIPDSIYEYDYQILVIDDSSVYNTYMKQQGISHITAVRLSYKRS
ncbi:MAG: hypothetical protein H8E00_00375 [Deltaproteobacteria bacterium]|nr:hypothetical protein [Deltaproteobacteria bacterium]